MKEKHTVKYEKSAVVVYPFVYCALTGKTYKKHNRKKEIPLRGLSQQERVALKNIAKNKDRSVNRLLLTYVRIGISQEPKQNLVYED